MSSEIRPSTSTRTQQMRQAVRGLFHLTAIVLLTLWGFMDWDMPFPGILVGVGALALSVVVWALFLSPKPVLRTDRFGQALIELLLLAAGVGAMLALGVNWIIATAFGLIGAILGFVSSLRSN